MGEYQPTFADCGISGHQCVIYSFTSSVIFGIISSIVCLVVALGVAGDLFWVPFPLC